MSYYRLHFDFETFSECDIRDGTDAYARHGTTEVLMMAWAVDDGPVQLWCPAEGEEMPDELWEHILNPKCIKFAWNSTFEKAIWEHVLGYKIPNDQWRDPMVLAMSCSFPGSLDKVGAILEIDDDKKKHTRGKALIRRFCVPRKPTKTKAWTRCDQFTDPEEWEEFKQYCLNDVEAEREIWLTLRPYNMPTHEWNFWVIDQEINQSGIPIHLPMVDGAIRIYEEAVAEYFGEMARITGLANPNSNKQILPWLQDHGYPFEDLIKGHVQRAKERAEEDLKDPFLTDEERESIQDLATVLDLRMKSSAASVKKYYALKRSTAVDGLLRHCFAFCGAQRTWRWGGRIFQPQNLPRPDWPFSMGAKDKGEDMDAYVDRLLDYSDDIETLHAPDIHLIHGDPISLLKSMVRPAVQAPDGYVFGDADLNAIENRCLGWEAGDQKILGVFHNNRDPYVDFASHMYGIPYDTLYAEYKAGDKSKRTVGKPAVLGCGYQLGPGEEKENKKTGEIEATGLLGYAWNMGVKLTQEESRLSVEVFRDTFSAVKNMWYEIEAAAVRCVKTGRPTEFRMLRFVRTGPFLRMILPSGRPINYYKPRLDPKRTPWGEMKEQVTYMGLSTGGQWVRQSTYGGKLTENATQAIARDLLVHAMGLAHQRGLDIRLHVHDQIVILSKEDRAEEELRILQECLGVNPQWAPDLPLASAGHISKVFVKD